ncbi:MAG: S41 family peptidase [Candidatus Lokiarchaeia archaeon]
MKTIYLIILIVSLGCQTNRNQKLIDSENRKEFNAFITDLEKDYIYFNDKKNIIDCIKQEYGQHVDTISKSYYKVMFYENLLYELYDSHLILNSNTDKSYRPLGASIYVKLKNNKIYIKNVFSSQLDNVFISNIINSEILLLNGIDFQQMIESFPTKCHEKNKPEIKEWIANKILSGRRNESRIIHLKLSNGDRIDIDIDSLNQKKNVALLESSIDDDIGIIRINNSLGNSDLIELFDNALDSLMNTNALILDLRNTPNGGNTSVAEPIMGRFISKKEDYQICENKNEKYTKYVIPRNHMYSKPLYVLVGRWTGSMGEGMAIGFDGMNIATIVGTEMNRLAGGIKIIKFLNSDFDFSVSFEKMYHLNGTLRETFVPDEYIVQENVSEDEFIEHAKKLIKNSKLQNLDY